ncbi:uncharacterized protein LACBIDRAFT_332086 [Laccaria bicolor S238N-H82]|uniref:Predicted protein n=1 Tax=Laccaria bicolor (strain S238N-H82 / ATCC MYA-4686) TaxID=486041 RepID=B0DRI8_LACBS|nr:uncharacterized protein LACBIDRAFT_332086 [Laccaria bicolor S238N-H82]EDR02792.1 predicted protein [Laccaria bicolor S238N-H82]|eukprot:XP_001886502.1 predicted protein [Laccaria bicolor S238N-H82]
MFCGCWGGFIGCGVFDCQEGWLIIGTPYPHLFKAHYGVSSVDLSLTRIESFAVESYDEDASASMRSIPQLRSFALCFHSSHYSMRLLQVRRPNDVPVLDFSNIQKLTVNIGSAFDVTVAHAFIKATEKLETLEYTGTHHHLDGKSDVVPHPQ